MIALLPVHRPALQAAEPAEPIRIGRQRQLFLDDHLIERTEHLTRRVQVARKHEANPLIVKEHAWKPEGCFLPSVLFDDEEKVFKAWIDGGGVGVFYFTSKDGIRCESSDFIHWTPEKGELVMASDAQDTATTEIYDLRSVTYEGLHIGLIHMFLNNPDSVTLPIQLGVSRDNKTWQRLSDRSPFRGSFGLASIQRDRFVAMEGNYRPGLLRTKPFIHDGGTLHVNAAVKFGALTVSLLDDQGAAIQKVLIEGRDTTDIPIPELTKLPGRKGQCDSNSPSRTDGCFRSGWSKDMRRKVRLSQKQSLNG